MATWAKCSDLFLYTKGNDVYLWRCNKTTWMPLITADFDDLGKVTDYLDLIGGKDSILEWEKSSYIDLVAYISPRRLLVNSRGLVFAELGKFGQDGKINENELPFYIRSLDVLSLKPFGLRDRTIPRRTVRYLETEGIAALVEDSTTTTELDDGKRADLEKQVAELKDANKTLKSDKEAAGKQVTELKEANKTLKSDKEAADKQVTELKETNKSDKEAADKQVVELKETNKTIKEAADKQVRELKEKNKRIKEAADKQVTNLKETNKTLRSEKETADKQIMELQGQIETLKRSWLKTYITSTTDTSNWVGFEGLPEIICTNVGVSGRNSGSFTVDDNTCNIWANDLIQTFPNLKVDDTLSSQKGYKGVAIVPSRLFQIEEKGRFDKTKWFCLKSSNGCIYAVKMFD